MRKYRVKSKLRFTFFLTILIVFSIFTIGSFFGFFDASSLDEQSYIVVKVQHGDTLWDLAKQYGPQNEDCRQVIYEICKLNDLTPETLWVGQEILIPEQI